MRDLADQRATRFVEIVAASNLRTRIRAEARQVVLASSGDGGEIDVGRGDTIRDQYLVGVADAVEVHLDLAPVVALGGVRRHQAYRSFGGRQSHVAIQRFPQN